MTEVEVRHRSVSQLKSYTRCGEAYRIDRSDDTSYPAAWTILGLAFHDAYDLWEKSGRSTDFVADFGRLYDKEVELSLERQPDKSLWGKPPTWGFDKTIGHYRNRGTIKDVPQYMKRCLAAEYSVYATEVQFKLPLGDIEIWGAIDRILEYPNGTFAVEDTKTGSADDYEYDTRQLKFYGYAANSQRITPHPIRSARYWFTKTDRPGDWVDVDLGGAYWYDTFGTLDWMIGEGEFLANPGKICGLCPHRKDKCTFFNPS